MTDDHNVACTINQLWDMAIGPCGRPAEVRELAREEGTTVRAWIHRAVRDAIDEGLDLAHPDSIVHSDEDAVDTLIAACFMGSV